MKRKHFAPSSGIDSGNTHAIYDFKRYMLLVLVGQVAGFGYSPEVQSLWW